MNEEVMRLEALRLAMQLPSRANPYAQMQGGGLGALLAEKSAATVIADARAIYEFMRGEPKQRRRK